MRVTVHSFDVFDTLLVRTWAQPSDLFHALAEDLIADGLCTRTPSDWRALREASERDARQGVPSGEVGLAQIYSLLAQRMGWSLADAQRAMKAEVDLEVASLFPVPETTATVQHLHDLGQSVVYLSDMYLPASVIQQALGRHGIWQTGDKLYVSSEHLANKASGRLFDLFLSECGLPPAQLKHTGDNHHSDVEVPRQRGVTAVHFESARLSRHEQRLADAPQLSVKFRSMLAGAGRLCRLHNPEPDPRRRAIWDATVDVVAPVLFGFVYWCLTEAQAQGIRRLYFVARDGQILLEIAKTICAAWRIDMECRYLYGSRMAWHFPAIVELDDEVMEWVFDPTHFLSVRAVCERVQLQPEQIADALRAEGFEPAAWDANLDRPQRSALRQVFDQADVRQLIVSTAAAYRQSALAYFRQEGLDDGTPMAIVDIGWHGRLQRSLSRLLTVAGRAPESGLTGFYFGLSKRVRASPKDRLFAYFSDVDTPAVRDALCHRSLLEIFVAADHGSTVKFELRAGSWQAVLRSDRNHRACDWGLDAQQAAARAFATQLVQQLRPQDCDLHSFVQASEILLDEFVRRPSQPEADSYGVFSFSEDQTETTGHELAPRYGLRDVARWVLYQRQPHHNAWLEASFARSPGWVRWMGQSQFVELLARAARR